MPGAGGGGLTADVTLTFVRLSLSLSAQKEEAMSMDFRFDSRLNKLTWESKDEPLTIEEAIVISAQQLAYAVEQIAEAIRSLTDLYARKQDTKRLPFRHALQAVV
jgi:hypothetical protein